MDTKQLIIKTAQEIIDEKGNFDFGYNTDIDYLFEHLQQELGEDIMSFDVGLRGNASGEDWWLQTEYYSRKLGKAIIWEYDTGDFDDVEEVADFIIRTEQEIAEFERQLPDLSPVAYL